MRLIWEHPPIVADEPLAAGADRDRADHRRLDVQDWSDFRAWYAEAVQRLHRARRRRCAQLAAELTKGKTTREEKLAALFDFVADDIRYVNYTSGEWWLPNRPQQLLARREGDCDDKAMLLITLLKAVGIDAQEVMVQTRMTAQPSSSSPRTRPCRSSTTASRSCRGPNGGTYLDATSPQSRLGPLPSMDAQGGRAAAWTPARPRLSTSRRASPDDHGVEVDWTITLKRRRLGRSRRRRARTSGDGAFWLRTNLSQPDARAQLRREQPHRRLVPDRRRRQERSTSRGTCRTARRG